MIGSFIKVHASQEDIEFVNGVFLPDISVDTYPHILIHFKHLFHFTILLNIFDHTQVLQRIMPKRQLFVLL